MEIRARYTLIGAFVLAATVAVFSFVYWLNSGGGIGARTVYRIQYENTVSGLLKGSAVLFNGVRVGEVTSLQLDARQPSRINVSVAVDPATPIKADTKVGIDFQGLSGAPVVSMMGGTPAAGSPKREGGEPALLIADPDAGVSVMAAAREAVKKIDAVVAANAEPLKNLIANVDIFAGALARNADKVDGIIAGIEKFTGGGKGNQNIIDLNAVTGLKLARLPAGVLMVPDPNAMSSFDTNKLLVRSQAGEQKELNSTQWPDALPKVVQARIVQSFENAGYLKALSRSVEGMNTDYQLLLDVRKFQVSVAATAVAEVEYGVKLVSSSGKVLDARVFRAETQATAIDPKAVGDAFDKAFTNTVSDLVPWACNVLIAADRSAEKKVSTP